MGEKVTFDPINKIIQVTQAPINNLVEIDVQVDLYSDGKEDWLNSSELIKYDFPIKAIGGNPLPGSKELGRTYFISPPWRIKPYEGSHTLRVVGNLFMTDGSSPYTATDGSFTINIESQVSNLVDSTVAQLEELQYSSYQNRVWVDVNTSNSGVDYPSGTREYPVNNAQDATAIANNKGFGSIAILTDTTLSTGDDLSGFTVIGMNPTRTTVIIEDTADVANAEFRECTVKGTLDGNVLITKCIVEDLEYMSGIISDSWIKGTIALGGSVNAHILGCHSGEVGNTAPRIDMGGSGQSLGVRDYHGRLEIYNMTGSLDNAYINMSSGEVVLEDTITAGNIFVRGICALTNNSGGAAVNVDGRVAVVGNSGSFREDATLVADAVWNEQTSEHQIDGSTGKAISTASTGGVDYGALADAVWDEPDADHQTSGTFGGVISNIVDYTKQVKDIQEGKWEIKNNQMIFYGPSDEVLLTYNLYDKDGDPAETEVYKREPV